MKFSILVDFGSTYTKLVCVNMKERAVVATAKYPSTVGSDAAIGLYQCFEVARAAIGIGNFKSAFKLATSSAAGGLRMAVVGLTRAVSIKAGRNASFCAGAKIVYSFAGLLSEADLRPLEGSGAEILLLCGGYEGGNSQGLIHNAEMLSQSKLAIPIVYAGNSSVAWQLRKILQARKKECFLAENTIPILGSLNIKPATSVIRELFMRRITNMKGIGLVQKIIGQPIIPTPVAVLSAGKLLSCGNRNETGLGPLMIADIGGATTDIYSYIENKGFSGAKMIGTPDPFAKRTVEGDMGMRESSASLVSEVGERKFAERCGVSELFLKKAVKKRTVCTEYLGDDDLEKKIDRYIACTAVNIASRRHAGHVTKEYNSGCHLIQRGKNLTGLRMIVGTGGMFVNEGDSVGILKNATLETSESGQVLLPEKLDVLVDRDYVFFAAGLLRKYDQSASLAIMKKSLGLCKKGNRERNGY